MAKNLSPLGNIALKSSDPSEGECTSFVTSNKGIINNGVVFALRAQKSACL